MSDSNNYRAALDQIRTIERAVVEGDLVTASEEARQLMPLLQVDNFADARALQAKVDALKASVHTTQQSLAQRMVHSRQRRQGCNTYQNIQQVAQNPISQG